MKTKNKRKLALMILFIMVLQVILPLCSINTNVVEAASEEDEFNLIKKLYDKLEKMENNDLSAGYKMKTNKDGNSDAAVKRIPVQVEGKTKVVYWVHKGSASYVCQYKVKDLIKEFKKEYDEDDGVGYIYFDKSVDKLGTSPFGDDDICNGLLGGNRLIEIPEGAFKNHDNISYIIGFTKVEKIHASSFRDMNNLKYISRVRQPEVYWK